MAISILEPALEAGYSDNIVVNEGEKQIVALYPDVDGKIEPGFYCALERQNVNGEFYPVSTYELGPIQLKHDCNIICIVIAGTYRVHRPDLVELGITSAVGVQVG